MPKTQNGTVSVHLRLPADLKAQLDSAAAENDRSINSELIQRLKESFAGVSGPDEAAIRLKVLKEVQALWEPRMAEIESALKVFGITRKVKR